MEVDSSRKKNISLFSGIEAIINKLRQTPTRRLTLARCASAGTEGKEGVGLRTS
jgi:hypothetical protein